MADLCLANSCPPDSGPLRRFFTASATPYTGSVRQLSSELCWHRRSVSPITILAQQFHAVGLASTGRQRRQFARPLAKVHDVAKAIYTLRQQMADFAFKRPVVLFGLNL